MACLVQVSKRACVVMQDAVLAHECRSFREERLLLWNSVEACDFSSLLISDLEGLYDICGPKSQQSSSKHARSTPAVSVLIAIAGLLLRNSNQITKFRNPHHLLSIPVPVAEFTLANDNPDKAPFLHCLLLSGRKLSPGCAGTL